MLSSIVRGYFPRVSSNKKLATSYSLMIDSVVSIIHFQNHTYEKLISKTRPPVPTMNKIA